MFCPEMSKYPLQIVFYLRRVSMWLSTIITNMTFVLFTKRLTSRVNRAFASSVLHLDNRISESLSYED